MTARTFDLRVLLSLARGVPRAGSHAERLQAFYGPQSEHYDDFRERLLAGRRELLTVLAPHDGASVVELGGGTGYNLTYFGGGLDRLGDVAIVDLCPALLHQARRRWSGRGNVRVIEADAAVYRPSDPVDCVYFSYSLTMMPDWQAALENALSMLKPGGMIGVVDFYVSKSRPRPGEAAHNAFIRTFWPRWFAHDGVRLSPDTLEWLRARLPDHVVREHMATVPYVPFLRVPYYIFVGRT